MEFPSRNLPLQIFQDHGSSVVKADLSEFNRKVPALGWVLCGHIQIQTLRLLPLQPSHHYRCDFGDRFARTLVRCICHRVPVTTGSRGDRWVVKVDDVDRRDLGNLIQRKVIVSNRMENSRTEFLEP